MAHRRRGSGIIVNHDVRQPVIVQPTDISRDIIKNLDRYDVDTDTWVSLSSMNKGRAGFALHNINNILFAIGGTDGSILHRSTEMFDTTVATPIWLDAASMDIARCYFQSVVVGSDIYIFGGITSDGFGKTSITNAVEKYDTITNTWTTLSPMEINSVPLGVAMGVAFHNSGKIYILSGYVRDTIHLNTSIFEYNIILNSWAKTDLNGDNASIYQRLLPFYIIKDDTISLIDGAFSGSFVKSDAYIYTAGGAVAAADNTFSELPISRFSGASVSIGSIFYLIGGATDKSNTLRSFNAIDTSGPQPYAYTSLANIERGRSSHAAASVGNSIYIGGGIMSRFPNNYLYVGVEAIPSTIRLDGKQTGAVDVRVYDENGDSPSSILVRVSATYTAHGSNTVLFAEDDIYVNDGYGMATLLPRSDDGARTMGIGTDVSYNVTVSAAVIDSQYTGETAAPSPTEESNFSVIDPNQGTGRISFPDWVDEKTIEYESVTLPDQSQQGSYLQLKSIAQFLQLSPTFQRGKATNVNWYSDIDYLSIVRAIIDDGNGTSAQIRDHLDRMSREYPFGGSTMLDSLFKAANVITMDVSLAKKMIYVSTDGEENGSHYNTAEIISKLRSLSLVDKIPVTFSVYRVVPDVLALDQGLRGISSDVDSISDATGGSSQYIITDTDVASYLEAIITSKGFIGSGTFSFEIDLGEDVKIENLCGNFSIVDSQTSAYWQYSIGNEDHVFGPISELIEANRNITLQYTIGRFIRVEALFFANLDSDLYNASRLVPPRLTSFDVKYHDKTVSYIYLLPREDKFATHQVLLTLDATRGHGSEINIGASTQKSSSWDDFSSPACPTVDNSNKIVIPIRQQLGTESVGTLEPLLSVDGFIYEAKYGKWADNASVTVFTAAGETVVDSAYGIFPDRGYIVFNEKHNENYILSISNKPTIDTAVEIVNRVAGEPVVISGAGFMYSTLEPHSVSKPMSNSLPDVINVLLTPFKPNVNSVFVADYLYYDLKGRTEKGTKIRWFINSLEHEDLRDLKQWDNKSWQFAKTGDVIYFTIQPFAKEDFSLIPGKTVKSLAVQLA